MKQKAREIAAEWTRRRISVDVACDGSTDLPSAPRRARELYAFIAENEDTIIQILRAFAGRDGDKG